ncbi:hypothetical protein HKT47_32900, partial [Pseudomonas aeruginosa]|nr:hypothetical protein [Pseudomonas aeruginosa]
MNAADPLYMARALELARQGLYSTHPNPRVAFEISGIDELKKENFGPVLHVVRY